MCADSRPSSRDALRRPRGVRPWSDPTQFLRSALICVAAGSAVVTLVGGLAAQSPPSPLGFSFTNIAAAAGLTSRTVYGGEKTNKYLLETTGCGAAALDYDNDGWMDIFLVNGTTLEGFPKGRSRPITSIATRVTAPSKTSPPVPGWRQSGWGQGACAGDYDNDGHDDLFVTYWGQNRLYRNKGDGTFADVTIAGRARAGPRPRGAPAARSSTTTATASSISLAANYIDLELASTPTPDSGLCRYKGIPVACGPPGLPGGKQRALSQHAAASSRTCPRRRASPARGTYGLGVATLDFDADGWVDVYVANDSNPSALYRNNRDGTFTDIGVTAGCAYSQDGKPQAGMGVAVGDYDRNGTMDIFKTNFAGDTSTLYANTGAGLCEDRTFAGGIGLNTRWLGWGVGFLDLDGDGWLDLLLVNGHVYPEVERVKTEAGYKQRKVVYQNQRNGRFADVTMQLGAPVTEPRASRGAAFADFDNDGDVDVVVNNVHDVPELYRLDRAGKPRWIGVKLVGTTSNRSAIGARVKVTTADGVQSQEVRGGGSYYSQNDLRALFRPRRSGSHRARSRCAGRTAASSRSAASPSTVFTR